jgi:mono/diheme cytochrome c family protein
MKKILAVSAMVFVSNVCAIDFTKQIKPILEDNCLKCHNSKKDKGDLNLETLKSSVKGGESGASIVIGNINKSLLIEKIKLPADHDDIMPPKGDPLTKKQISLLESWIKDGAKWPKNTILKETPKKNTTPKKTVKIEATLRPAGHRILATDKGMIAIVGYDGKIEWQHKARSVHDLKQLANGNILFQTDKTTIVEVNPKTNKKVFEYNSATMNGNKGKKIEVHSFSRLKNGHTMIAESGATRIIEVDNSGKIHNQFKLQVKNPHPHRDTRLVTVTDKDNYLVAHEGDGIIKEYTRDGKVVWEYAVPLFDKKPARGHGPTAWGNQAFCALRLPNGNTLIATGNGHSVLEVSPEKEIVWHLEQNDLKGITLAWVTTLELLPNGNYMIGNCHAGPDNPQIIEINKNKEVIWSFKDFNNFGNALSNSQILDAADDLAFFNNKVHPVLEANCLKCHGHDEKHMKGGLWLESRYDALKGGDIAGAKVFTPDNINESALLKHIHWVDEDHQMPPKKQMTPADIQIITEWVSRGLPYNPYTENVAEGALLTEVNAKTKAFWSYQPVKKPAIPSVKNNNWPQNDIDKFILAKLESKGMRPNGETDKTALIRRVYYDLTGLPPSPEDINDFVNNKDPKAYENLLNKLLASQQYGEKWGRHWLDIVRYAETNSYERDGHKPHAWKYRQWVIDSFNKDKPYDQMILEQLAGDEMEKPTAESITATGYYRLGIWDDEPADRLQSLYDEYDDIVKTTSEAFMGMTVACARCHNHKIDPIPTKDYYGMLAIFHNIKPYSRGGHENTILTDVADDKTLKELALKNKEIDKKRQVTIDEMRRIEKTLTDKREVAQKSDIQNLKFKFYRDTWLKLPDFDMHKAEEQGSMPNNFFDISNASRKTAFGYVFEGELIVPKTTEYTFNLNSDDGSELFIAGKSIIKFDGIHGFSRQSKSKTIHLTKGIHKIKLTYFQNEQGLGLKVSWQQKDGWFRPLSSSGPAPKVNFRKLLNNEGRKLLGEKTFKRYKALEKNLKALKPASSGQKVLSVREKGKVAPDTFVFRRGNPHSPADKVEPHYPIVLTDTKPNIKATTNSSGRRLAFAKWLVDENPQTARVMANRIWQFHFGRGIVRTTNNFGNQGDRPTHPALLEYIAASFKENDWSIKKLHKLIMTSATYKMSSKGNEDYLIKDPANDLFWRFNMRRLTGEEIRDSILATIGKLDLTYGGKSVFPTVSKEVLAGQSKVKWRNGPEPDQYRRSIYTFQMRSLIFPLVESFDAATTDSSCAVRFQTTLPTQALTMMNGELLNQSAELMAQNVRESAGTDLQAQLGYLWSRVTGKKISPSQVQTGLAFMKKIKTLGASDEKSLQQLCLIVLNLNEFIYLD